MTAGRTTLTDGAIRAALTEEPPEGATTLVWTEVLAGIAVTPQRRRTVITWPWTPVLPGVGPSHQTRRFQHVALLVALALLVVSTLAAISVIGSLRRLPPPTGLARAGLIAYDSGGDIFVANADGTGVRRITTGPAWDVEPTWSQEGTRIAYQSLVDDDTEARLIVIDPDGSNPTTIDSRQIASPGRAYLREWFRASWAPDGRAIAFTTFVGGRTQIEIVNADGSGSVIVGDRTREGENPVWSPDGSKIAFRGGRFDDERGVYVMDAEGSNVRRLTAPRTNINTTQSYLEPVWSPDGRQIAYHILLHDNNSVDGIWSSVQVSVVDARDGVERAISDDVADNEYGAWSPDGTRIAYTRWIAGQTPQIVVADGDGSNSVILPAAFRGTPTWSPDGTKIVGHAFNGNGSVADTEIEIIDVATGSVQTIPVADPGPDGDNSLVGHASWQRLAK
ncbi:MAG: DPP IV N-terminal domain-containing protein [Chloroflexota bacterium]